MTTTMRMNTPPSGPNSRLEGIAEQIDHQQQQGQLRQRQEEIGQPHQAAPTAPRDMPAMAPTMMPTTMATTIAAKPTASEMRPP